MRRWASLRRRAATVPARGPAGQAAGAADAQGETVCRVLSGKDDVIFRGCLWKVPTCFRGETVAIRPLLQTGGFGELLRY